jgi:hypothetical protein
VLHRCYGPNTYHQKHITCWFTSWTWMISNNLNDWKSSIPVQAPRSSNWWMLVGVRQGVGPFFMGLAELIITRLGSLRHCQAFCNGGASASIAISLEQHYIMLITWFPILIRSDLLVQSFHMDRHSRPSGCWWEGYLVDANETPKGPGWWPLQSPPSKRSLQFSSLSKKLLSNEEWEMRKLAAFPLPQLLRRDINTGASLH